MGYCYITEVKITEVEGRRDGLVVLTDEGEHPQDAKSGKRTEFIMQHK